MGDKRRRNALLALILIYGLMGAAMMGGVWLAVNSSQAAEPPAVAQVPPTATVTLTPTPTATATRAGLVVVTRAPTATPFPTATPTETPTPTPTATPTVTFTLTPTPTPTDTPAPTATPTGTPVSMAALAQALPLTTPVVPDVRGQEAAALSAASRSLLADYQVAANALAAQMALVDADSLRLGYGDWVAETAGIVNRLRALSARGHKLPAGGAGVAEIQAVVAIFDLALDALEAGLGALDATELSEFRRYFAAARAGLNALSRR